MRKSVIIVGSVLVLAMVSCKSKSKAQSSSNTSTSKTGTGNTTAATSTAQPTVYNGVTDNACALEMAFGSYGAGIDGAAFDKVNNLLDAKKLKHTSKSIGREGEQRICMPLTELKEKEKNELIEQLKKIAAEGQLVSLSIR